MAANSSGNDGAREGPLRGSLDEARALLFVTLQRLEARLARRIRAVHADLARADDAARLAEDTRIFVAEAARAPRGTAKLVASDWSTGEEVRRERALDSAKSPREQIEAVFAQARRLKRGAPVGHARLAEAETILQRIAALRVVAAGAASASDLHRVWFEAHIAEPSIPGPPGSTRRDARGHAGGKRDARRCPYRTFLTVGGARIFVGRGAKDNDELTLHVAKPRDLWLHTRHQAGAHVVVPLAKGAVVPGDLLVDAAHLAAHFSDARGAAVVDITYAPRRYVRKPRGSPPGLVTVDREKVLLLRIEPDRLATLLARESA